MLCNLLQWPINATLHVNEINGSSVGGCILWKVKPSCSVICKNSVNVPCLQAIKPVLTFHRHILQLLFSMFKMSQDEIELIDEYVPLEITGDIRIILCECFNILEKTLWGCSQNITKISNECYGNV